MRLLRAEPLGVRRQAHADGRTVGSSLQIHFSEALAKAVRGDPLTRQYYGRPPLLESLFLPEDAQRPARKYLDWHKTNVFIA